LARYPLWGATAVLLATPLTRLLALIVLWARARAWWLFMPAFCGLVIFLLGIIRRFYA
jgi:hypothetical protein